MSQDEETEPLWVSGEKDHLIPSRGESSSEPLFGSGKIPLEGDDNGEFPNSRGDEESQGNTNYGSISKRRSYEDKNDFGSTRSSPARSSKPGPSKQAKKDKAKKKQPPPKSVFDDDQSGKEAKDDGDDASSVTNTEALETKPHMPAPNYCLYFFRLVACVAIVGSLGLIATQIIPLVLAPEKQGFLDFALKVYVSLFCVLFLLVEFDAPIRFIRNSQLLALYLSRGFLYSFLGLICVSEAYSERVKEIVQTHADEFHVAWASLFMQLSSWLMLGCGLFYMLMGIFCLKRVRDKLSKKDREAWAKYRRDMKEWKQLNAK